MIMKNSAGFRQVGVMARYRGVTWPQITPPGSMMTITAKSSYPFPFTGTFGSGIISPPPPVTIYFQATLKDGSRYEYGYACPTEDDADEKLLQLNPESLTFIRGPVPVGGLFFNTDKLGGAYYKILA
jgi:hypothetical protein